MYAFPVGVRDTDGDGLPDYRDLDSDDDGLSDLVESGAQDTNNDGILDSSADQDQDAIPDQFDISYSGGNDSDGDGIDDRFDVDFLNDGDQDGDGIADQFDPDANGDGYADDVNNGLTLAAALPDLDNNGVPDLQQSGSGELRSGLSGRGGCSVGGSNDSSLLLLLLVSIVWTLRRKRCSKTAARVGVFLIVGAYCVNLSADDIVDEVGNDFDRQYYFSAGVGASSLDPDDSESIAKVTDKSDVAFNFALGLDFSNRFFV